MKRIFLLLSIIFVLSVNYSFPQSIKQRASLIEKEKLISLALKHTADFQSEQQQAIRVAKEKGWPIHVEGDDGSIIALQKLTSGGMPFYYKTHNLNAAKTVSTDKVWPGGITGYQLSGIGLTIGEWDGGAVLKSHQEFGGRVTQVDGATQTISHATHVAGTLIAAGVIPNARGMAFEAHLDAYDWDDDIAEMATAAANGLLISNHSYGYVVGWEYNLFNDGRWLWFGDPQISETEDFNFGFYSDVSQAWDSVTYLAPDYLIVKSAGNDRNTTGPATTITQHWVWKNGEWVLSNTKRNPDNLYNSVSHVAVAKNVLSIGAIEDIARGYAQPADAIMASFSCWGPTDDGRIKPDIVANGISLYSTTNSSNTSYGYNSGTSMAAPNAAGSLLLLQEHYKNTHDGAHLKAATLKALVIQTADEVGKTIGPDYEFGWGLLNTASAAQFISGDPDENTIIESTLQQGETYTIAVYADQANSLVATMVWTDPPGTPPAASLNPPDKMLVNDLDLRLHNGQATYSPWTLNPANPENAAVPGDNITDNIEQVYIASPATGVYTLTVSHKNTLQERAQAFSLVINAKLNAAPVIINPIADQTLREDFPDITIADLTTVFDDENFPSLSFSVQNESNITAFIEETNLTLSAVHDYYGFCQVIVTADDGYAATSDTFFVNITPVNDAPVLADLPDISFAEDSSFTLPLNSYVSDVDDDTTGIHFTAGVIQSEKSNLLIAIDSITNMAYLSAAPDSYGVFLVQFTAIDDSGAANSDTIQVTVNSVNDAPSFLQIPGIVFDEDSSYVFALNSYLNDPDHDTTELKIFAEVINASSYAGELDITVHDLNIEIDSLTHRVRIYSHQDFFGLFTVEFTAVDPAAASGVDTVTVTITPVNDPPFVKQAIPDTAISEDSGTNLLLGDLYHFFSDVDNKELTFTMSTENGLNLVLYENSISVIPTDNYFGLNNVVITASDGMASVSDTFRVNVRAVNDPPVLRKLPNIMFNEDSSCTLRLNPYVSDVDHDTTEIHFSSRVLLAKGLQNMEALMVTPHDLVISIDSTSNIATFTASSDSAGQFAVAFMAMDDSGATAADTITVRVAPVNDPPVVIKAIPDTSILEDSEMYVLVENLYSIFSDADRQPLDFSVTSDSGISAAIHNDALQIKPEPDFYGDVRLIVTASDLFYSASDTLIITVENVNDAPTTFSLLLPAPVDTLKILDQPVTFQWRAASDIDGDALFYTFHLFSPVNDTIVTNIPDTTVTINNGTFWQPGTQYSWTATVTDGQITSASRDTFVLFIPFFDAVTNQNQALPEQFVLYQNYPNPFNPVTSIRFGLPKASHVKIEIYNVHGQRVATITDEFFKPGYHDVHFDANQLASGIYIYRLKAGSYIAQKKMILMK